MSRRRGEFEHRTSIFEGAFRAWSHLGGLEPEDLESKPAADLDPLTNPVENDSRKGPEKNTPGRREYPYEPLPRSGLAHPYVQAILSPWLGPDADNEAIQLGLTTLRTWWQHRRKGESGSAIAALGTEKMKGVVEGYTRHFFTLAHCLIVNDKEQPPRTLHAKMKELDKLRSKKNKKRAREDVGGRGAPDLNNGLAASINADLTNAALTPLERLHAAQRRQLAEDGAIHNSATGMDMTSGASAPIISLKGKCIPGKIDLPGVIDAVNRQATQLAHRGTAAPAATSSGGDAALSSQYGDRNTTPVVFASSNGDIQIAMRVDGITCAHCVKIVETVLKGCNGNKSPIDGLLDAAADRDLCSVLIKINKASNAKRIAFEAARNLAMVGYTAKVKEMSIVGQGADKKVTMDLGALSTAFEVVASTDQKDVFDWTIPCTCPDNGVLREDCARHSQMNTRIFDAFDFREQQVTEYMAGCGMKYGMECTCGPECRCKNCPVHSNAEQQQIADPAALQAPVLEPPLNIDQPMEFFGMGPPAAMPSVSQMGQFPMDPPPPAAGASLPIPLHQGSETSRTQRNPSVISYGNGLRHMSITSETTFGRAMSGLSALSIDWENLEDFDLDVDHSAHINNNVSSAAKMGDSDPAAAPIAIPTAVGGPRRSSLRRSHVAPPGDQEPHVSFKV